MPICRSSPLQKHSNFCPRAESRFRSGIIPREKRESLFHFSLTLHSEFFGATSPFWKSAQLPELFPSLDFHFLFVTESRRRKTISNELPSWDGKFQLLLWWWEFLFIPLLSFTKIMRRMYSCLANTRNNKEFSFGWEVVRVPIAQFWWQLLETSFQFSSGRFANCYCSVLAQQISGKMKNIIGLLQKCSFVLHFERLAVPKNFEKLRGQVRPFSGQMLIC